MCSGRSISSRHPSWPLQVAMLNPQLGTMLRNPQMRAMLSSPEFMQSLSNPAVMQVRR